MTEASYISRAHLYEFNSITCATSLILIVSLLMYIPQASFPPPPKDKKYLTFSHQFGTNTSSLETFLLERKIKGPCWLEIKHPEQVQAKVSWCKLEVACEKMEHISVIRNDADLEPPPIIVATVSLIFFSANFDISVDYKVFIPKV